jgi:hypothetical protein
MTWAANCGLGSRYPPVTSALCIDMARPSAANALVRAGGYYVGRLFGGNRRPLEHLARQSLEICPRLQFRAWQPYFDPRHLSRIENAVHYTAKQIIEEHLLRRQIEFTPVRINWLDDAWIIDGSVFVPGGQRIELRNVLERGPLFRRMSCNPAKPFAHYEFGALVGACAGSTWFGHWLEDEVPLFICWPRCTAIRLPKSGESIPTSAATWGRLDCQCQHALA